jgi:hypothetical protein
MSWISTYYHTVGAHPVRSAVGASLAAGAVTAIAAFRWVNRQVSGGNVSHYNKSEYLSLKVRI